MPLADTSRLLQAPAGLWGALAQRLRSLGVTVDGVGRFARLARAMPTPYARTMRCWHLRREPGAAACAMRMFLFADPVTPEQARAALGEIPVDRLVEAGLLARGADGSIVSPFLMNLVNDLYVVCDDLSNGEDAVMGAGETTADLCNAAYPSTSIDSALDLGCGAGTGALLVAPRARRVLGTDINPRAIVLSRLNAAINGVRHAEFRQGDLFGPVGDETFDLIFSQPPFVAGPETAGAPTYLHGGARGDELALRILSGLSGRLRPGGRAVLLVEWPDVGEEGIESRIRRALGAPDLSVMVLVGTEIDLDEHCAWYALGEHPGDLAAYERKASLRREHLERMGIRALRLAFNVIWRGPVAPGWTSSVEARPLTKVRVTSARIGRLLAARDLVAGGREALLRASLGVPEGATFCEERGAPDADAPATIRVDLPDEALVPPIVLNPEAAALVSRVHRAASVREAADGFAADFGATAEESLAKIVPAVEQALLYGLLEVR